MAQKLKSCGSALLVGFFLTTAWGYGQELQSKQVVTDSSPQAEAALAASIPRRELELALAQRKNVLAEVEKRMEEMGLSASASELTDLLERRAHLSLDMDKCLLGSAKAGACRAVKAELAAVEASFYEKTGLSTSEFRSGRLDTAGRPAEVAGAAAVANAAGDSCTCAFTVYSLDRWMNRWWALECNNHGSHGVCSNNVDSAHSPGSGAMTGDIDLYFGGHHAHRECPDDHRTCFQGPSTDHSGQWGNTCSCDAGHSQNHSPGLSWYGGDLTHSPAVNQMSTGWLTVGGACSDNTVTVGEFIKENDPWCCDDSMGTLWVSLPLTNGSGTVSGQASAQNCSGGSQSGVYPYCGTFGAQIQVAYSCSTYTPPPPPPPPECDPQQEEDCSRWGWIWDSNTCTCNPLILNFAPR